MALSPSAISVIHLFSCVCAGISILGFVFLVRITQLFIGVALASEYEYILIDAQDKKDAAYTCFFAATLYAGLTGLCVLLLYTDSKVVEPETFELNCLQKSFDDDDEENEEFPLMRG